MAKKQIRFGVAGLGRIGWSYHCRTIARHPDVMLAAVQDVDAARRQEAEQVYAVPAFTDFGEMLAQADLQAVVVATPTHLHRPMAEQALRAGLDVLLEKPMAEDASQAAAIVRTAKRHGRLLTVYQPRRAAAYFQHARRLLDSGLIGEVYHVRAGAFNYARRNDWQSLRKYGGGMLNNYGAHALDQLLQIAGYDVKRVFCSLRVVASLGDADDVVKVVFETRRGVLAEVDINQASVINPFHLQAWGTHGALSVSRNMDAITVRHFDPEKLGAKTLDRSLASAGRRYPEDDIAVEEDVIPVDGSLQVDFYADLARAIRTRRAPFVKPEEPLAVMKLIARCRESAGRVVRTR
jgi:scyllo-inositol 2-dehydrogenase (NADP+)